VQVRHGCLLNGDGPLRGASMPAADAARRGLSTPELPAWHLGIGATCALGVVLKPAPQCGRNARRIRDHSRLPMTTTLAREPRTAADSAPTTTTPVSYKVVIYQEGLLGSMFLGGSKVDPLKFSEFLNRNAREGWRVVTMEKDMRRTLLFWKREAYLVIMERAS
jgi:hypothetical protein